MKTRFISMLLLAATLFGCGGHHHSHEAEGEHDENLQLTAYSSNYEGYAEADPLVVGQECQVLAHFTHLENFKPLTSGKVTATIEISGKQVSQTLEKPTRRGIYKFFLKPDKAGEGCLLFNIQSDEGSSQIIVNNIRVYTDSHEAQHAAADAKATSSNGVCFTKEMSWNVDFSTEECREEYFGQVIRTMAQILPAQGDERVITAKASGIVILPAEGLLEGKEVRGGQTLFHIESSTLADDNLQVRYQEAVSKYEFAKKEYERKQELVKDKIVSESELLHAKAVYDAAKAVYDNLHRNFATGSQSVTAHIGGYLRQVMVRNGQFVEAGQPLLYVSQNRYLQIKAEVQPRYYNLLGDIASACIHIQNIGKSIELDTPLQVSYAHSLEQGKPLLPVVLQIENKSDLLQGSFVELFLRTRGERKVITVPDEALMEEMGTYFVYVQLTPEYFEKREVTIGMRNGCRTEICSGLQKGERVATRGAILIKLAQATGGLNAESGHVH